jgi:uncharacterized membrane protein YkoI
MQTTLTWFGAALLLVVLAAAGRSEEESVVLEKVPKAVREAVKARFPDAKATEAAKETEDGKVVYEVTIMNKEQKIDVTLTPEGELLMIEKQIEKKDLPKPVTKAIEEKYPKATYKIVEEINKVEKKKETLAYYEVLLETADKHRREVQVSAEGKILKEENKDAEKDGE